MPIDYGNRVRTVTLENQAVADAVEAARGATSVLAAMVRKPGKSRGDEHFHRDRRR